MYKYLENLTHGVYPFHMPGHKRNPLFLTPCPDITEITGADDLHHPDGIIDRSQEKATRLFGTKKTLYFTGGSTAAVLSAITASVKCGEPLLVARNCHKSVYNAAFVNSLSVDYIMPVWNGELSIYGEVTPSSVAEAFGKNKYSALVVTSPTYEGIVSDIKGIAEVVHQNGAILIVDAAHGAHLGFSQSFPPSARQQGADIVIESAHKTLPALTGAALLHICSDRIDQNSVFRAFSIFNSSSPSYPVIASIDRALDFIGDESLFCALSDRIDTLRKKVTACKHLKIIESPLLDKSKILLDCRAFKLNGIELKNLLLEKYKIECEMAMPSFVLCISSIADTDEGFNRLQNAILELDQLGTGQNRRLLPKPDCPEISLSIRRSSEMPCDRLPLTSATGRISAEYVYAYPPGSPIISPGEIISKSALAFIDILQKSGGKIYSSNHTLPEISVVK